MVNERDLKYPLCRFIVAGGGYWGKGTTVADAIRQAPYTWNEGQKVTVAKVDQGAYVDELGNFRCSNIVEIGTGTLVRKRKADPFAVQFDIS